MERTTWLTEERIAAPGTGAPLVRRDRVGGPSLDGFLVLKQAGSVPAAYGPGLVCGSTTVTFRINDHAAMGHIAWDGTPLGSRGAGYG